MAGSISLSLSQQFDSLGKPLSGGLLYTYAAGTTTPQSAFQDTGLVQALSNPVLLDSAGRIPQLFFADGNIKVRLTDAIGNVQLAADNILVIGQSSGGGGGATVDPTTVLQTGWIQPIYGVGNITGFVRLNGKTLGNASSGASERANADTTALFTFLYNADANLAVSGGRGANAAADYAANKTIALPDFRSASISGLDDMGNAASGRLTTAIFGTDPTVLGAGGGLQGGLLTAGQIPTIVSANGSQPISVTPVNNVPSTTGTIGNEAVTGGSGPPDAPTSNGTWGTAGVNSFAGTNSITTTYTNNSQTNLVTSGIKRLITIYIKL